MLSLSLRAQAGLRSPRRGLSAITREVSDLPDNLPSGIGYFVCRSLARGWDESEPILACAAQTDYHMFSEAATWPGKFLCALRHVRSNSVPSRFCCWMTAITSDRGWAAADLGPRTSDRGRDGCRPASPARSDRPRGVASDVG